MAGYLAGLNWGQLNLNTQKLQTDLLRSDAPARLKRWLFSQSKSTLDGLAQEFQVQLPPKSVKEDVGNAVWAAFDHNALLHLKTFYQKKSAAVAVNRPGKSGGSKP